VYPDYREWLAEHLPPEDDTLVLSSVAERIGMAMAKRYPAAVSRVRPHAERVLTAAVRWRRVPRGPHDQLLLQRGSQVVHLPFQDALATDLPSIYHPHDLQHLHLPQFFTEAQIRHRETVWRERALKAFAVSVGTKSVADDVERMWLVPRDRIHVIPLAPVAGLTAASTTTSSASTPPLVLYPAAFWAHKNHVTLIRAIGMLRADMPIQLVLPGAPVGIYDAVRREVVAAGLDPVTTLPGYVSQDELSRLYSRSSVVAVPSTFEAASFPIWEAFQRGVPVVAANTTSLPAQVGDGGLIFEPFDVGALAAALRRLLTDDALRTRMGQRGRDRVSEFSWARVALASAALYRRAAADPPVAAEEQALENDNTF
jgi:glycosyltransferase involved in cell wall biosynthesis